MPFFESHNSAFKKVCEDVCTYVCDHPKPTAASNAVINIKENEVSSAFELLERPVCGIFPEAFSAVDFTCVTNSASLVPLSAIEQILDEDIDDPRKIFDMARQRALSLTCEPSKNDVIEQIIQRKIGSDFNVSKRVPKKKSEL